MLDNHRRGLLLNDDSFSMNVLNRGLDPEAVCSAGHVENSSRMIGILRVHKIELEKIRSVHGKL